jgi:hypothetical protein
MRCRPGRGAIFLVFVKPQTYRVRFLLFTLVRGLSDLNLVLLATISYNELSTETHMSLCRRHRYIPRVSEVYLGKWGECVLRSTNPMRYKVLVLLIQSAKQSMLSGLSRNPIGFSSALLKFCPSGGRPGSVPRFT